MMIAQDVRRLLSVLTIGAISTGAIAGLTPPKPINLETGIDLYSTGNGIVRDARWAAILGKALFWDIQAGSDGQACASCHFSAGADSRITNAFTPGLVRSPTEDTLFGSITDFDGEPVPGALEGLTKSQSEGLNADPLDATYTLLEEDFPLHHIEDYKDRNSAILITTNDAVSSSGAYASVFTRIAGRTAMERCKKPDASVFHAGRYPARQVEPRNTPTTINAVFNLLNFWDGRANDIFNGVGVFGPLDIGESPNKRLVVLDDNGNPELGFLEVTNASLASQAVGPPLSDTEMSCDGKTFADFGKKMLSTSIRPLQYQTVDPNDSLFGNNGPFGSLIHSSGKGLNVSYATMIKQAFEPKYWAGRGRFNITDGTLSIYTANGSPDGYYPQIVHNFSAFWGLAIMMYEAMLVSDQSPFDEWFALCRPLVDNLGDPNAVPIDDPRVRCRDADGIAIEVDVMDPASLVPGFGPQEVLGFGLFNNGGTGIRNPGSPACGGCHTITNPTADPFLFPVFSEAQFQDGQSLVPVERSRIDFVDPPAEIVDNCTAVDTDEDGITDIYRCGGVHDRGFFNIGVTPSSFDPGNGGLDPYGNPLSASRMFLAEQAGEVVPDPTGIGNRCTTATLIEPGGTPTFPGCEDPENPTLLDEDMELELVDGTFKTPSTRNIGLTAPYFHNGAYATLRQVVEFYARGGSRRDKSLVNAGYTGDTSGSGPLGKGPIPPAGPDFGTNVDFFVRDVKSTEEQIDALVAFMLALTDERVRCDAAPFDHPELPVLNGHTATDVNRDRKADDVMAVVPAVGAGGYQEAGLAELCLPNTGNLFDPELRNRLIATP